LTPEYINENWTDELFYLMFKARKERILRMSESTPSRHDRVNRVSADALLGKMSKGQNKITKVKVNAG
jgi:hypothetical protein